MPPLLPRNSRGLGHLRPLLDLGPQERGVFPGAVAGGLVALPDVEVAGLGRLELLRDDLVDPADDGLRRYGGREDAVPVVARESLDALLGDGGDVGEER